MRQSSRLTLFAVTAVVLVIGALGYRYYSQNPHVLNKLPNFPSLPLSAGVPLSNESTSQIQVLPGQDGETPTPVTDSTEKLPSTTSITLPEPVTTVTLTQPVVFDQNAAQLGTTLSLLLNAWPQGGPLPRKLAEAAYQLAAKSGQMDLARAAALLRTSTPREGPITLNVLLLETSQALTLDPPANLPVNAAAAEKEKSWFRRQLEQIVTISNVPATQSRWSNSLAVVQQALVRGAVNDAAQRLESSPLSGDSRLDTLRDSVHNYLGQNGKLTQLITSYTNTYLINGNTE